MTDDEYTFSEERSDQIKRLMEDFERNRISFKTSVEMLLECVYWAQNQCSFEAAQAAIKKYTALTSKVTRTV